MPAKEPEIKVMSASEVRKHFAETVNEVARGEIRVLIEKNGLPGVAVIAARDLERLQDIDRERAEIFRRLAEARDALPDIDPEELEREAAKAIAEVRAEQAAERARDGSESAA